MLLICIAGSGTVESNALYDTRIYSFLVLLSARISVSHEKRIFFVQYISDAFQYRNEVQVSLKCAVGHDDAGGSTSFSIAVARGRLC